MKKYLIMIGMIVTLFGTNIPLASTGVAIASDDQFQIKMDMIEERAKRLRMVIKKLSRTHKKAKEDYAFMKKNGMPEADIIRLEHAFQQKIKHMINQAIDEINAI